MTDEAQSVTSEPSSITQFYYSIGEFDILLEPTVKTEIVEQRNIYPIPHAPEWCRGMISLRGKLIPVVNTHRLLGCSLKNQTHWLLIVETNDLPPVAIRIDKLPMQHQVLPNELQAVTDDSIPFWFKHSISSSNGNTIYQANHTELFQLLALQNQQIKQPANTHLNSSGIEA